MALFWAKTQELGEKDGEWRKRREKSWRTELENRVGEDGEDGEDRERVGEKMAIIQFRDQASQIRPRGG